MSKTKNFVETLRELSEACNRLNEAIADLNATLAKINAEQTEHEFEPPKRDIKADKELIRQKLAEKATAGKKRKCGIYFISSTPRS